MIQKISLYRIPMGNMEMYEGGGYFMFTVENHFLFIRGRSNVEAMHLMLGPLLRTIEKIICRIVFLLS